MIKLIVGLGNKGKEYKDTRHNVGFMFLDAYAKRNKIKINKIGFKSRYYKGKIKDQDVILLKPETYMNLSGEAIKEVMTYYKVDLDNMLIIYDDMDLPFGEIRVREKGSAGGHNGMKNIILHLNSTNIKRVRFGIGKGENATAYVLGKFSKEYLKIIEEKKTVLNNLIDDFLSMDFEKLMSKYNKNE